MGTNFYAHTRGNDTDPLHIGKRSAGWDFMFHSIPAAGLTSVAAWREFLAQDTVEVRDEYAVPHTLDEFMTTVLARFTDDGRAVIRHGLHEDFRADPKVHVDLDADGTPFLDAEFC